MSRSLSLKLSVTELVDERSAVDSMAVTSLSDRSLLCLLEAPLEASEMTEPVEEEGFDGTSRNKQQEEEDFKIRKRQSS
jgi:hypothetical protein